MKLLAIGNSFSEDALRYAEEVFKDNGIKLEAYNLYIGGCDLDRHMQNIISNAKAYDLMINDVKIPNVSIQEALEIDDFDVITIQQASHYSGLIDKYEPGLEFIYNYLKENYKNSKIIFHQTWAYDKTSDHSMFYLYDKDQEKMYGMIEKTVAKIKDKYKFEVIYNGRLIQKFRDLGVSFPLTRDGFHLSLDYGRYIAAVGYYLYISGNKSIKGNFYPFGSDKDIIVYINKEIIKMI